ncbi:S8 family serine peptidase [Neolewinella aurantiaca]|uniref:S8 family serine peptidase n=1 Tax=Neolewinella aurantiaca TaxID=2602767 RepID=A0A5C7FE64_9BACT|nr:S8 family serine peptidase [Neolewinella aurantiaca]TXF89367.1 S8 family serine peptidase [Neolewinella aurantiaca]
MRPVSTLFTLFCLAFLLSATSLSAQQLDHRQGELIVQLGADVDAKNWLTAVPELTSFEPLGRRLNTWLLTYDFNVYSEAELRRKYWPDPAVVYLQRNHFIERRATPNDLRYDDQWQHVNSGQINGLIGADHNVESAWDITTGGVTINGDTIVVAVIDDGVDTDHEDIAPNLWINRDEIPGNGIDDDNNGYIDDYHGWNTSEDTSNIEAGQFDDHGTSVAGLVGAKGNNEVGVAGMNWDIKLMIIKNNFISLESEVIEAYSYALESRLLYDETNGTEGAYVVATNASWGRDFGNPDDAPIWCDLYDRLGEAGILNAGATANTNVDVDEDGDLPTACPSDYLISVTNLNTDNQKVNSAGFGLTSIDLGAYGRDAFTTDVGNNYAYFGGTSASTPSVAGAIALLYSAPCANFGELLVSDPAAAARRVSAALLNNVAPNESLAGITVTGGALDVGAAMSDLMTACDACLAPTSFVAAPPQGTADQITVSWRAVASLDAVDLRYRITGTNEWTTLSSPTSPYELTGLPACVSYDFQLVGNCGSSAVETEIQTVSTDGCCVIPEDLTIEAEAGQIFVANYSELLAGRFYRVRYRKLGEENWLTRTSNNGTIAVAGNIEPCTEYEFEFQTDCDTFQTDFGQRMTILSFGCGSCEEADYCTPDEFDNETEWIGAVNIGDIIVNESGAEAGAYTSFGNLTDRAFVRGGVYPVTLTPASAEGILAEEDFRIYVDWDQNGRFSSTEIVLEMESVAGEPVTGLITVPEDADLLLTRMRIMMQYRGVRGGACPVSTGFGEVEDYCINIAEADGCPAPRALTASYDNDAGQTVFTWPASAAPGGSYRLRYRPTDSMDDWAEVDTDTTYVSVDGANLCGTNEIEIASVCDSVAGVFQAFVFDNVCTDTPDGRLEAAAWSVFPNPAANLATVRWSDGLQPREVQLFDLTGKKISTSANTSGTSATLDLSALPAGVYLVRVITQDGLAGTRRLIRQ